MPAVLCRRSWEPTLSGNAQSNGLLHSHPHEECGSGLVKSEQRAINAAASV